MRAIARETLAALIVLLVLVGLPLAVLAYEKAFAQQFTATVWARVPERGGFSPSEIRVRQGEQVRLRVIGDDVVHGFAIPELGVLVQEIKPGEETIVEFTADRPGRFRFMCTVICSPQHARMTGEVVVEPRS